MRPGRGRILQVSSAGGQTTYPGFGYYHAAKWGVEGFCETLAAEVALFGIGATIIEPGATPTGSSTAVDSAPVMVEHDRGPVGDVRRAIANGSFRTTDAPVAIACAMIESADGAEAPQRLPLGDDTCRGVRASHVRRLELLDASRDLALSVAGAGPPPERGLPPPRHRPAGRCRAWRAAGGGGPTAGTPWAAPGFPGRWSGRAQAAGSSTVLIHPSSRRSNVS